MAGLGGIGLTGEIFSIFLNYCLNKKDRFLSLERKTSFLKKTKSQKEIGPLSSWKWLSTKRIETVLLRICSSPRKVVNGRVFLLFSKEKIKKLDKIGNSTEKRNWSKSLEKVDDKRVRVFKVDRKTEIKNFVFLEKKYSHCPKLLVILGDYNGVGLPYLFLDGIVANSTPTISPPDYFDGSIAKYTYGSMTAVVKGQLYFFGGWFGGYRVRSFRDS